MRDKQYEGIVTKQEYVSHLRVRIKSIYARCRKSAKVTKSLNRSQCPCLCLDDDDEDDYSILT